MAQKDMALIIGGQLIPKPKTFKRLNEPNETDRVTLGGTLSTDFINRRESWELKWDLMTEEDFNIIKTLYEDQYTNETYHMLQFDAYSLYLPVKIEISNQDIKYNGNLIENFSIILKQQYAVS